jgi:predicted lipoprotein with Yx(FWY)xxD motif
MNRSLVAVITTAVIIASLFAFGITYSAPSMALTQQIDVNTLAQQVKTLNQSVMSLNQTVTALNQTLTAILNPSIRLGYLDTIGFYLEGPSGRALYYFAMDLPSSGHSNLTVAGLAIWTPFYAPNITLLVNSPVALNASDFSTIMGTNGVNQTTYRGWPLYYFNNDTGPGQIGGQGYFNLWWVMKPTYTVMLAYKASVGGLYLTNNMGRTLYHFLNDTPGSGTSNATSPALTQNWPPFYAQVPVAPSYLNVTAFSMIILPDGSKETTYKGWPLHYFYNDTKPGDTNGQGLLNLWYAMTP